MPDVSCNCRGLGCLIVAPRSFVSSSAPEFGAPVVVSELLIFRRFSNPSSHILHSACIVCSDFWGAFVGEDGGGELIRLPVRAAEVSADVVLESRTSPTCPRIL